jgi:molecular chaperone GrpE
VSDRGNPSGNGPGAPSNGRTGTDVLEENEPLDPVLPAAKRPAPETMEDLQQRLQETEATLEVSGSRARETLDRLKETHERYLRAAADLENYRKRAAREREEAERFGISSLLKELLPVMDNLDRALDHLSEAEAQSALGQGVVATRRIFEDVLAKFGVKPFTAKGEVFDPNRHEAMQRLETDVVPPGTVAQELLRGYTLNDRLIRPALVSVAVPKGGSGAASGEEPE